MLPSPNSKLNKGSSPERGSLYLFGYWAGFGTESEAQRFAKRITASEQRELVPKGLMPKASTKSSHPDQFRIRKIGFLTRRGSRFFVSGCRSGSGTERQVHAEANAVGRQADRREAHPLTPTNSLLPQVVSQFSLSQAAYSDSPISLAASSVMT